MSAARTDQLTRWPLRAKVTVALLVIVLLAVTSSTAGLSPASDVAATTTTTTTAPVAEETTTSAPTPSTAPPTPTTTTAPPATTSTTAAPAPSSSADLAALRIDDSRSAPGGYDRDLFPTWLDLDGNGCDARDDTLAAESLVPVQQAGCEITVGQWHSIYDGVTVADPSALDVDHVVALGEAWRSGAHAWEPLRRARFANDLSYPDHLIAVTASTNRSKGDSPPNEWRPPRQDSWCRYATAWVDIKVTWELTATTSERDALGQMLETC